MSAQPAQTFPLSPLDEERAQLLRASWTDSMRVVAMIWIHGRHRVRARWRGHSLLPLNDAGGNGIHTWDSRGHTFRTAYDRVRLADR
jgi:hypothetical protein